MLSRDASGLDVSSSTAARWRLLRNAGVEIVVIVASYKSGSWDEKGLRVIGSEGGKITRFFRLYSFAKREIQSIDLITAQDPFELGFVAWMLARLFHKPFEIQDHGGFFDGEKPDEPLWALRKWLAFFLVKRAHLVRTVSPLSLARLEVMHVSAKYYHLPIAANDSCAQVEREPEAGLIVSVGRLIPVKRHDLTIRAFALLHTAIQDTKLVLVGDGPLRSKLEAFAKQLRVANAIEFTGHTDPLPFLSRAALFVMLSSHEGWGVAAVEAALAGVPVLMTRTGCAKWLEGQEAAKTVPVDITAEKAGQEMKKALVSPDRFKQLTKALSLDEAAREQVNAWKSP